MAIEWYPGHMTKARREIAAAINSIDVVIEIVDARLPASSANPVLGKLRGQKPCIRVLNKADLADPLVTGRWIKSLEVEQGLYPLPLSARDRNDTTRLLNLCRSLAPHRLKHDRSLRAMVVGIPNVGKSTLINTLAGKKMAKVGDRPAITTCQQQINLRNGILLYDTPGILWPDMRNQKGAYRLAASGAIGDNAVDAYDVGLFTAELLAERYAEQLLERYKLAELPQTPALIIDAIGRQRGCLVSGGSVDLHRAAELLLRELRGGQLGRISLETPEDRAADLLSTDDADFPLP